VKAAAAVVVSALASGLPALVAAAAVTILVLAMACWVIADAGRSANTAELLRAARGDLPASLQADSGQRRALPSAGRQHAAGDPGRPRAGLALARACG
jgi:hypothetical protein